MTWPRGLEPQYRVRDEFGRLFNRGKKQLWLWRVTFSFFNIIPLSFAAVFETTLLLAILDISSAKTICHHLFWQMKRQWKTKNKTFPIKHLTFQIELQTQFLWNFVSVLNHPNYNDELESVIWTTITVFCDNFEKELIYGTEIDLSRFSMTRNRLYLWPRFDYW